MNFQKLIKILVLLLPIAWIGFSIYQYNHREYMLFSLMSIVFGFTLLYSLVSAFIFLRNNANKLLLALPLASSFIGLTLLLFPQLIGDWWQYYFALLIIMLTLAIQYALKMDTVSKSILNITGTFISGLCLFEISDPIPYAIGFTLFLMSLGFCLIAIFKKNPN